MVTITPQKTENGDEIITAEHFKNIIKHKDNEAIVIRTAPNEAEKINKHYSNTNAPYVLNDAITHLLSLGIDHILIDLPSVDREFDEGKLLSHHVFWNYPQAPQTHRTITEMIFVNNQVPDGQYLLNIMVAPFENDASPSKPVLYKIIG